VTLAGPALDNTTLAPENADADTKLRASSDLAWSADTEEAQPAARRPWRSAAVYAAAIFAGATLLVAVLGLVGRVIYDDHARQRPTVVADPPTTVTVAAAPSFQPWWPSAPDASRGGIVITTTPTLIPTVTVTAEPPPVTVMPAPTATQPAPFNDGDGTLDAHDEAFLAALRRDNIMIYSGTRLVQQARVICSKRAAGVSGEDVAAQLRGAYPGSYTIYDSYAVVSDSTKYYCPQYY
jgi:Protein of unknown function (DUF732)